jgi:hypothetical protein
MNYKRPNTEDWNARVQSASSAFWAALLATCGIDHDIVKVFVELLKIPQASR